MGADNYQPLLSEPGLSRQDFMLSLRNTFYYVVGVVPLQTVLALSLAVIVNQRFLKGRTFFRTAFYFPSVVSSVAISLVFLYLFTGGGAVNQALDAIGIDGPQWFSDSRGLVHLLGNGLGLWDSSDPPAALADHDVMGLSLWEWFKGPSVALSAIMMQVVWTTAGTFMLMFLAALQDVPTDVEEAAMVDGASKWNVFRYVTLPHLRPTLVLVLTLGVIGTWQVFDQMYIMTDGGPSKTTLTPAFLSYQAAFEQQHWGQGAAIAFLLFALILVLTQHPAVVPARQGRVGPQEGAARAASQGEGGMTDLNPLGSTGSGIETAGEGRALTQVHTGTPPRGAGRAHRASPGTKVLVYGALLFFALLYLYPFAVQLVTAFKTDPDAVANPLSFVPDPFSTAAFARLFETDFTLWFANSVVVSLCVTAGRVFFDSLAGYALARMRFRGRVGVFNAVIAVMAVPGVVLLIPKFLVLNYLGIYNTYPALFLPLIADAAGVFIMKQFFETIPVSVEEAARIDGAGPFRTFWSVVLPMAKPALITLTILSFQSSWNELAALHHRHQRPPAVHADPWGGGS